jgi:hypothetical protein
MAAVLNRPMYSRSNPNGKLDSGLLKHNTLVSRLASYSIRSTYPTQVDVYLEVLRVGVVLRCYLPLL